MTFRFFLSFVFCLSFCFGDRVLAVVGQKAILESSVNEQILAYKQALGSSFVDEDSLKTNVLNYLINQEVLIYFAKQDTLLIVDESQTQPMVRERLSFFKNQLGSIDALESYFGLDYREIESYLQEEANNVFLSELFRKKLMSYVSVSSKDVKEFYSTYKDSLPLTPKLYSYSCFHKNSFSFGGGKDRAKKEASLALEKINSGASFESFYSTFSGGDLGFFRRGTFVQEFEEVAFSLEKNEVGGPVLSPLGFHIIRLNDRLGEKINASHILFEIKNSDKDFDVLKQDVENVRNSCFLNSNLCDSIFKNSTKSGDLGGVFSLVPENLVDSQVLNLLKNLSLDSLSETVRLKDDSFLFVRLDSVVGPQTPDMYEYWGFLEGVVLEKKFSSFLDDWLNKNKNKVYIKVFE